MFAIVTMKLIAPSSDDEREDVQAEDPVVLAVSRAERGSRTAAGTTSSPAFAGPPEAKKLMYSTIPPSRNSQYESAFSRGNAMSRAPIISGTRKLPKPARIGTTTRKTIVVPWIVNTSL